MQFFAYSMFKIPNSGVIFSFNAPRFQLKSPLPFCSSHFDTKYMFMFYSKLSGFVDPIQGYIQRHIYIVTENLETMGLFREGTMTGDSIILL